MDDIFFKQDDNKVAEIATHTMRMLGQSATAEKICSSSVYWMALSRLYVVMARNKEVILMGDMDRSEKDRMWKSVRPYAAGKARWVQVSMCQALYVYELLNNRND